MTGFTDIQTAPDSADGKASSSWSQDSKGFGDHDAHDDNNDANDDNGADHEEMTVRAPSVAAHATFNIPSVPSTPLTASTMGASNNKNNNKSPDIDEMESVDNNSARNNYNPAPRRSVHFANPTTVPPLTHSGFSGSRSQGSSLNSALADVHELAAGDEATPLVVSSQQDGHQRRFSSSERSNRHIPGQSVLSMGSTSSEQSTVASTRANGGSRFGLFKEMSALLIQRGVRLATSVLTFSEASDSRQESESDVNKANNTHQTTNHGDDGGGASGRHARTQLIMASFKGAIPPDSVLIRYWYCITTLIAVYSYVVLTQTIVWDNAHNHGGEVALHVVCSVMLMLDWYLHHRWIRVKYAAAWHHWLDLVIALPYEILLYFVDVSYAGRVFFMLVRALKLFRVPWMFQTSLPDAIDVHYVVFFYQVLPTARFFVWVLLFIHSLAISKLLCDDNEETNKDYHAAITWVWIVLTSAPFSVTARGSKEPILAGFMMTCSMILQGYIVGAMSMLVFSYNVQEENRTQMLTTLAMLRHYNLPEPVVQEVLSFKYHILEDSSMYADSSTALDRLPPMMLREIQLYVKVDVISRVKFFELASKDCLTSIADVMQQRIVEPETDIIVVGDIGDAMYFMMHGLADVVLPGDVCVATIRRGDFFGEIAMLSGDSRRKATVTTLTYCDVLELQRDDFDAVISEYPEFLDYIRSRRETDELNTSKESVNERNLSIAVPSVDLSQSFDPDALEEYRRSSTLHDLDVTSLHTLGSRMLKRLASARHARTRIGSGLVHHPAEQKVANPLLSPQRGCLSSSSIMSSPKEDSAGSIPVGIVTARAPSPTTPTTGHHQMGGGGTPRLSVDWQASQSDVLYETSAVHDAGTDNINNKSIVDLYAAASEDAPLPTEQAQPVGVEDGASLHRLTSMMQELTQRVGNIEHLLVTAVLGGVNQNAHKAPTTPTTSTSATTNNNNRASLSSQFEGSANFGTSAMSVGTSHSQASHHIPYYQTHNNSHTTISNTNNSTDPLWRSTAFSSSSYRRASMPTAARGSDHQHNQYPLPKSSKHTTSK
eukprot:PhM_4_TR18629/c0_g1_i6/m.27153